MTNGKFVALFTGFDWKWVARLQEGMGSMGFDVNSKYGVSVVMTVFCFTDKSAYNCVISCNWAA